MIDFSKYIGLSFKHKGRSFDGVDCYGLFALILKEEKGIQLPEYEYSFDWDKEGCRHIQEKVSNFPSWERLEEPSNPLDLILFYSSPSRKISNHMGIYIGNDRFIHSSILYKSKVDILNDFWRSKIYIVLRVDFES
jgi:cell wall-associated NlpC family hydrolase